jgi:hypothetical protein
MSSNRKHDPVNDLCVESITTASREQRKREKLCNFHLEKMYEQKQKAIICVLVGEQQFCKIFLRERDSEISAVFFLRLPLFIGLTLCLLFCAKNKLLRNSIDRTN